MCFYFSTEQLHLTLKETLCYSIRYAQDFVVYGSRGATGYEENSGKGHQSHG